MFIITYKSFFISFSLVLVIAAGVLMSTYGIKRGIDFTGGSIIEINYATSTMPQSDVAALEALDVKAYKLSGNQYRFVSTKSYEETKAAYESVLNKNNNPYAETQVSSVGPTLGAEMTKKAIIALIVVILAILAFIAFSFREVSLPVSSWKYGVIAMVTLIHDIIVPTGVYVLLSHYYGAEIDTLFIIALLTIIGISISDKIVVFDRIRENLKHTTKKASFEEVVGESLKQTFTRSINTSVTVVLALLALFFFGPAMTKWFTLTLIVGMVVGTYSSIFVASPLLTVWNKNK
jgi:preprotein translocase subunit SecF